MNTARWPTLQAFVECLQVAYLHALEYQNCNQGLTNQGEFWERGFPCVNQGCWCPVSGSVPSTIFAFGSVYHTPGIHECNSWMRTATDIVCLCTLSVTSEPSDTCSHDHAGPLAATWHSVQLGSTSWQRHLFSSHRT